jgi:hypothetical protein
MNYTIQNHINPIPPAQKYPIINQPGLDIRNGAIG